MKNLIQVLFLILMVSPLAFSKDREGLEDELNFLEFYAQHAEMLDKDAPFAYSVESFAQYHQALLEVIAQFEKKYPYEKSFPVEGSMTKLNTVRGTQDLMFLLLAEAVAQGNEAICFYGGWPSKMSHEKCLAPWKSIDDDLKKIGDVYDRSHHCGGSNLFRCNPTIFGPGEEGHGICIKFNHVDEISEKCELESRTQIEKLYRQFLQDENFRKQYLSLVGLMKNFCQSRSDYKACSVLKLQVEKIENKTCKEDFHVSVFHSNRGLGALARSIGVITPKIKKDKEPAKEKAEEQKPQRPSSLDQGALCSVMKSFIGRGVPEEPLRQAMTYFSNNKSKFSNQKYISIGDYSQNSREKRFYILDLTTGEVQQEKVSHGSGRSSRGFEGDERHNGMIERCQNRDGERKNMTRPGFFKTGSLEYSDHLASSGSPNFFKGQRLNKLTLIGLSPTNGDALGSGVVMHEATYNQAGDAVMGRSYGCPAFVPGRGGPIVKKITDGSLYYSYVPVCGKDMQKVLADEKVKNWQETCR